MTPVENVILIVIDGLRPDALLQANTPNLDGLMARGAYSLDAQSVMPSITLPAHMSMFHSVTPAVHKIEGNLWMPNGSLGHGIVDLVHAEGKNTAAFYTWEQLRDLWRPGAMNFAYFTNIYSQPVRNTDLEAARAAADYLPQAKPAFTFIYLGLVDEIGHRHGWMTPEYLEAVQNADNAIGHLLARLEGENLLESTAILVQADHGGHDRKHGQPIPEDMTIPWILAGPGIKRGLRLQNPVSILDSAPTMAHLLGLEIPATWEGKVVQEALE